VNLQLLKTILFLVLSSVFTRHQVRQAQLVELGHLRLLELKLLAKLEHSTSHLQHQVVTRLLAFKA